MSAGTKAKDEMMAKYMKEHPGRFPDSISRPWQGNGAGTRKEAMNMGRYIGENSTRDRGIIGGIMASKLGFSSFGVEHYI